MQKPVEKSQSFRIDALLAEEPARPVPSVSPESSAGSPGACLRTETPSPCAPQGLVPLPSAAFIPKPGLLNLPPPALGGLPALYPPPLYPIPALAGQHSAFAYPAAFPPLSQPGVEPLKVGVGSFPLEHWIRAGIMAPRFPDFHVARLPGLQKVPIQIRQDPISSAVDNCRKFGETVGGGIEVRIKDAKRVHKEGSQKNDSGGYKSCR